MSPSEEQEQTAPPAMPSKVELDLDDAPFLDDEEEDEKLSSHAEEEKSAPVKSDEEEKREDQPQQSGKKKVLLITGLASALCCAVGFWFFLREGAPLPEPPPIVEEKEELSLEEPEPQAREEKKIIQFEPFFIEYQQEGKTRFLECSFSLPVPSLIQNSEIRKHSFEIRDAIYFYLKNKDIFFLENKQHASQFKKDILNVINQHISSKPVTDILIEKYLVY